MQTSWLDARHVLSESGIATTLICGDSDGVFPLENCDKMKSFQRIAITLLRMQDARETSGGEQDSLEVPDRPVLLYYW